MKNLIRILVLGVCVVTAAQAQDITRIEYFIDNTDPGFGLATPVSFTPATDVSASFNVDVSSIGGGLHFLNVRVKNDSGWSLTRTQAFYSISSETPQISRLEYFIDTDPGFGNGTDVPITPSSSIDKSFVVNTSSTPPGLHTLYVRAGESNGTWGLTHAVPFVLLSSDPTNNITGIEYFFDTDPGPGSGTTVPMTPGTSISETFVVNTSSLSTGLHTLNIRVKDSGGQWSITHSRPIINISSDSQDITKLEYFFDVDPGFGLGNNVTITAGANLNTSFVADASGLTNGIHTLNLRTMDAAGRWSLTHSMPVIAVTQTNPNITAAEYFFNTDPGFGSGLSVPITPGTNVSETFAADVSGLPNGLHIFNLRVKDASGAWSIAHSVPFVKITGDFPEITTIEYFFDTDPGFGLATTVPFTPSANVNTAFVADVSGLPTGMHRLHVRAKDNAGNWSHVNVTNFMVIAEIPNVIAFEYAIDTDPGIGNATYVPVTAAADITRSIVIPLTSVPEGTRKLFFRPVDSNGSWGITQVYTFEVCNVETVSALTADLTTNSFRIMWDSVATATSYRLDVSSDNFASYVPGYQDLLVADTTALVTGLAANVTYQFRLRTQGYCLSVNSDTFAITTYEKTHPLDSAILVQLYNNTGGASWTNRTNWLTTPAAAWHGIDVEGTRVRAIALPVNALTGNIPASIADLDSLNLIDVSGNQLTGLPNLTALTDLNNLNVANNRLTFEDLEPNIGVPVFMYSPQAVIGAADSLVYSEGDTITIARTVGGTANVYQWQLNDADFSGQTTNTLNKIASLDDNGYWRLKVTNTTVTGLELFTAPVAITVQQLGITGDSLALVSLYNSTGGPTWTNRTNWLTGNVSTWHGITVDDDDVIGVNLANNNLQGVPNDSLARLFDVKTINLSNNKLTGLPNLTGLDSLTTLDVSNNLLQFAPLEINMGIENFAYANQGTVGNETTVNVRVHDPHTMNAIVSGANNSYQWKFEGTAIPAANSSAYQIAEAGRSDMGQYVCEITNSAVPGLTLTTGAVNVLVVADMSGRLYATTGEAATAGKVTLFRIAAEGGYDTVSIGAIQNTGDYMFEDIVLDEYQLLGFADTITYDRALPTYYANTLYWEEADTVFLEDHTTGLDIITQLEPLGQPTGQGVITGTVIDNDHPHPHPDGRTDAPKRLKNAAVSARKVESTGRGKEEVLTLVVYGFTDENGEFEFTNLPQAEYRMNVQYPGFPMDETSSIDITVGSNLEAEKKIEAEVAEGKIGVRVLVVTSIWSLEDYHAEVYPNPAQSVARIRFKGTSANRNIRMTDISSRSVLQQNANAAEVTLDLSKLATGMYLINIDEDGKKVKTLRLEIH